MKDLDIRYLRILDLRNHVMVTRRKRAASSCSSITTDTMRVERFSFGETYDGDLFSVDRFRHARIIVDEVDGEDICVTYSTCVEASSILQR
jgi:hypothetical protein